MNKELLNLFNSRHNSMYCCYCGREIKGSKQYSADDYQLHYSTRNKETCEKCYKLITSTNRELSLYLQEHSPKMKNTHLQNIILSLQEILQEDE